jgi:hypothetical protein
MPREGVSESAAERRKRRGDEPSRQKPLRYCGHSRIRISSVTWRYMHCLRVNESMRAREKGVSERRATSLAPKARTHLITITTEAILGKEPTFRHLSQIVLVHEIATIALLAQAPQPMLADGPGMGIQRDGWGRLKVLRRGRNVA